MILKLKFLLLFVLAALPLSVSAFCEPVLTHVDQIQIQRDSGANGWCFISLHPFWNTPNLVYRDYLISNNGLLMVFNSYGPEQNSTSTGAREFYFFPRLNADLNISFDENDSSQPVTVTLSNGKNVFFSPKTAEISGLENGQMKLDSKISPKNAGGLEILKYDGLWLDAGFALGHSPAENSSEKAKFTDALGKTCLVLKSDIFVPSNNNNPKSDKEISALIKAKCPQLKVDF